jgi:hypothetical protein
MVPGSWRGRSARVLALKTRWFLGVRSEKNHYARAAQPVTNIISTTNTGWENPQNFPRHKTHRPSSGGETRIIGRSEQRAGHQTANRNGGILRRPSGAQGVLENSLAADPNDSIPR